MKLNEIYIGDARSVLSTLPDKSVSCCVTSPPYYGLRDYGVTGQIGQEDTPEEYIKRLVDIFREIRRILTDEGVLWLNIGDCYWRGKGRNGERTGEDQQERYREGKSINRGCSNTGIKNTITAQNGKHEVIKPKDLIGIPWMLAFALRADGWYLRQEIIWHKPNPMPESVKDRCTKSHESIFLFTKSPRYYFDYEAIMEPAKYDGRKDTRAKGSHKYSQPGVTGLKPQTFAARGHERWTVKDGIYLRNKRSVWTVATKPLREEHFAPYPEGLITDCIKAGCPQDGVVIDPFFGSGTTGVVSRKLSRSYIGIELNPEYVGIARKRLNAVFNTV
ncbi:Modification methylase DpnIIB [termite gut metagenome]|uniref:site-specific DNA-methyltransferase (cytosine-N(4)-specific) n=1 Tax=termite gut metagenome TaxID=433724 RepID=A0A5J4SRI2_9ZZZZ